MCCIWTNNIRICVPTVRYLGEAALAHVRGTANILHTLKSFWWKNTKKENKKW